MRRNRNRKPQTGETYNAIGMRDAIQFCAGDPSPLMAEPNSRLGFSGDRRNVPTRSIKKKDGFVLPLTLAVLVILGIGAASMAQVALSNQNSTTQDLDRNAAMAAADGGINAAVDQLVAAQVPGGADKIGDADVTWTGHVTETGWMLEAVATLRGSTVSARALLENGHLTWLG